MAALTTALPPWDFSPQQHVGEISSLEANWTKEAVSTGVSLAPTDARTCKISTSTC